jgi:photosystem II stability/assembly factor-like uncharacterized protein
LLAAVSHAGDNKWTSSGPYGGRFTSFAFHPQINSLIFAGGGNGVFRSRNAGLSWQRLNIAGWSLVLAIHPRNPGVIYAARTSVYTSTDQGNTWQEIYRLNLSGFDGFSGLALHPTNTQILYGVTFANGVFKSTDGGKTWASKSSGLDTHLPPNCCSTARIEIDPSNPNILYVLLPSRKVFKTTNGGDSWKNTGKFDVGEYADALALDPQNRQTLYVGGSNGISKTTNGGGTWFTTNCGCLVSNLALDPHNSLVVYGGGYYAYVSKSTDGGKTWKELQTPFAGSGGLPGIAVHPKLNQLVFAAGFGSGVIRSQNGGQSWQVVNSGLDGVDVWQVVPNPHRSGQIFATSAPKLFVSSTSGTHWELYQPLRDGGVGIFQIHPHDPNMMLASGWDEMVVTTDGGRSWLYRLYDQLQSQTTEAIRFHPQDKTTLYMAPILRGNAYLGMAKSTNLGQTWKPINTGLTDKQVSFVVVDERNGSNVFIGTLQGRVFRTTNGGSNWRNISSGITGCCIRTIALDSTNSNVIYASGDGGIFKTTDGGRSWVRKVQGISSPRPMNWLMTDPSNPRTLYAGTYGGLYVSTDGAESWSAFDSSGLDPFQVNYVVKNPWGQEGLFIGTERGVFAYTRAATVAGPVIEQLAPSAGKPGDTIAINGRNFGPTQGDSKVFFGSVDAGTASSWSDARVQAKVPSNSSTGSVTVTVASKRSNPFEFIVLPASGNVQPTSGSSAGGTRVTILGPSGISGTQFNVLFGSTVARDIRFTSPNIITCTTPPGSGTVDVSVTSSAVVAKVGTFTYQ